MKNYLKILLMFIMFVVITFSCNEKSALQTGEFEFNFENVLKDNSTLLQGVNSIISEYNEDGHILRMAIIDSKKCAEMRYDFMDLDNFEQATVWKDRIISDLKNKKFNELQYKFLSEAYYIISAEGYMPETGANSQMQNKLQVMWDKLIDEDTDYEMLLPTVLKLSDEEMICNDDADKGPDDPYYDSRCNCMSNFYCSCQPSPCAFTMSGCGLFGTMPCHRKCSGGHF